MHAQVECPAVTPEAVLRASGHVDRFTDFMVTDAQTGDCHRADHLLKAALEALLADPKAGLSAEKRRVRAVGTHLPQPGLTRRPGMHAVACGNAFPWTLYAGQKRGTSVYVRCACRGLQQLPLVGAFPQTEVPHYGLGSQ